MEWGKRMAGDKRRVKVSLIIPVYNTAAYLRDCLGSVMRQTFQDWEALVVDDGSTDGSGELCRELSQQDPRIRPASQENRGVSAARNQALERARGEYLFFLDSDDAIHPRLLEELRQADPAAAERLHPADEKRILRALEVYLETGRTITEHNRESRTLPPRYDAVWIGLQFRDRQDLRDRIDRRVDAMAAAGLLEEVRALARLPRDATALQAIGCKELLGVLDGEKSLEDALEEVKLRSRQYAKRQLTWLRRNPDIHWIFWEGERDFARALQLSTEILSAAGVY